MSEHSLVNGQWSDILTGVKKQRIRAPQATRERILDAAAKLVEHDGVGAATTKQIAAKANVSEGSIYNHFADKPDLLITLVLERLPSIRGAFEKLYEPIHASPADRLSAALTAMIAFYARAQPVLAGIASDPELLKACRKRFIDADKGPHLAHEKLAEFLKGEQAAGRHRPGPSPHVVAALLIGACTEFASLSLVTGKTPGGLTKSEYAQAVVKAMGPMLFPASDP